MKVSLFITCLSDAIYPKVGEAMARLLARYGVELNFPKVQTCCGQPSYNSGYWDETRAAAKTILKAFDDSDFVVSPSGSCTYMIHHYPELFKDEPEWLDSARRLEQKTYEFTQFMVQVLGVTDVGASFPHTVTYHPSCHGTRLLGVKEEPMQLLGSVKGLQLVPLPFCRGLLWLWWYFCGKNVGYFGSHGDGKGGSYQGDGGRGAGWTGYGLPDEHCGKSPVSGRAGAGYASGRAAV